MAAAAAVLLVAAALLLFVDWRQLGPPSALVTFEARVNGETITIDGVTDLPDGTRLEWQAYEGEASEARHLVYGDTTTAAGRITASTIIAEQASGAMTIEVRFYAHASQPSATVERFGPNGENLRGSGVLEDSGTPVLVVKRQIALP